MENEVMKKLNEHDSQLEVIARTVAGNQERLTSVETRLDGVETRLSNVEVRLDSMDLKIEQMDQKMEQFVTREDHQEVMNALDKIIGLFEKKDQELTFMGHQVKRNTEAIEQIKPLVGLPSTGEA